MKVKLYKPLVFLLLLFPGLLAIGRDANPPQITKVEVPVNGFYKAGQTLEFTITFNEVVKILQTPFPGKLPVNIGGTIVNASYVNGDNSDQLLFSYTITSGLNDMDGIALGTQLTSLNGKLVDADGNEADPVLRNVASLTGVFVNTTHPTVSISTLPALINKPYDLTVTFSENVTGVHPDDFTVTNVTVGNLKKVNNATYTITITPVSNGPVSVSLPANVVVNIGDNGNSASNTVAATADITRPVVTQVAVPANDYYSAGETLNFDVRFTENIWVRNGGINNKLPIIIGSKTVYAVLLGVDGSNKLSYGYEIKDGDMDLDGIELGAEIYDPVGDLYDEAGNRIVPALVNYGSLVMVRVNSSRPSVTLSTNAPARLKTAFTVTAAFSEKVTDLVVGDFNITNGTAASLATSDNITYTFVVTPVATGEVSVKLPADKVLNIAENGNSASNTISVNADFAAPVITASQHFNIGENSANGSTVGTVAASDNSSILQNWTISSDGSNGGFAISNSGTITVANMSKVNAQVGKTVTLMITVSDGLNTSAATAVTVTVSSGNKAPTLDAIPDASFCFTTTAQTVQLSGASANDPGQTYMLSAVASQNVFDELTVSTSGLLRYKLKAGTPGGQVTITVTIKDDGGTANGGVDQFQRSFKITVKDLPVVKITSDKGTTVTKGETVRLTATGGNQYQWKNAEGIVSGQNTAVLEIKPQSNTVYEVTVTNADGCVNTGSVTISTADNSKGEISNILTPNGDGKNDRWVIRNIENYRDNEVKIFDRAGRLVYQRRNYLNEWDGTLNGKPLAEGVYFYVFTSDGNKKVMKGSITIVRDRY